MVLPQKYVECCRSDRQSASLRTPFSLLKKSTLLSVLVCSEPHCLWDVRHESSSYNIELRSLGLLSIPYHYCSFFVTSGLHSLPPALVVTNLNHPCHDHLKLHRLQTSLNYLLGEHHRMGESHWQDSIEVDFVEELLTEEQENDFPLSFINAIWVGPLLIFL